MNIRVLPRSVLAITLAFSLSGCSWAFMTKPPEPIMTPNYPVDCTDSRAAPVLDTICSGYFVVNTIVLAGAKSCDSALPGESCISSGTKSGGIALSLGLAALCGISAGSGYGRASRCSEVKVANAMCITGDEAACLKLNPAWKPPLKAPVAPAPAPAPNAAPTPPPPPPPAPPAPGT